MRTVEEIERDIEGLMDAYAFFDKITVYHREERMKPLIDRVNFLENEYKVTRVARVISDLESHRCPKCHATFRAIDRRVEWPMSIVVYACPVCSAKKNDKLYYDEIKSALDVNLMKIARKTEEDRVIDRLAAP